MGLSTCSYLHLDGLMLLVADVGNTNITFGVYEGDALKADWRLPTDIGRTSDAYAAALQSAVREACVSFDQLTGMAICSVVPRAANPLLRFAKLHLKNSDIFELTGDTHLGIQIHYDHPESLGADRLANAIAAHHLFPGTVIVVDLGTATTFEVVSDSGDFLGGAIAPGVQASMEALVGRTSQLPRVPLQAPPRAIANSTIANLQSGIIFGFAGQVDGIVERFRQELATEAHVVATGGFANLIAPHSRTIGQVHPTLTLEGLRIAYDRHIS